MIPRRSRRVAPRSRQRPADASRRARGLCSSLLAFAAGLAMAQAPMVDPPSVRALRGIPADAVALLLDGRARGDLAAEITVEPTGPAGPARPAEGRRWVAVRVEVPAAELATQPGSPSLELYVYAIGPDRQVRAHLAELHHLALGAPAADVASIGASVAGIAPEDRLRVLVRESGSTRFALRELDTTSLTVGAGGAGATAAGAAAAGAAAGAAGNGWRGDRDTVGGAQRRPPRRQSPEEAARSRARIKALARGYEEVLQAYASGASERAIEDLRRLESSALGDGGDDVAKRRAVLAQAQAQVVERLAEREPDSLVPLLLLHLEVHDRHLATRDLRLASHARDRVSEIAELYARTSTSTTAARLASDAIASIGSFLQSANQLTAGRKLLERAVELDGANLEARLCIALGYEVHGDYQSALAALDALSSFGSFDDEVRLRRATIQRRLGRIDEAVATYESLIAGAKEDWIVVVAYQELARVHLARDRAAAAVATLAQATRRFPSDGALGVQFAYALERNGERKRAAGVLELTARSSAATSTPPPRSRYQQGLERVGVRPELLARSALALLPMLAATLESAGGGTAVGGA